MNNTFKTIVKELIDGDFTGFIFQSEYGYQVSIDHRDSFSAVISPIFKTREEADKWLDSSFEYFKKGKSE